MGAIVLIGGHHVGRIGTLQKRAADQKTRRKRDVAIDSVGRVIECGLPSGWAGPDYCWTCHGEKLRNPGDGTSFDLRRLKPQDYARFVNSVLNGKNTMPPWRGVLDQTQIDAIWAYIRATVDR